MGKPHETNVFGRKLVVFRGRQTSVQWNATASALCRERRDAEVLTGRGDGGLFLGCDSMRASVVTAALDGALPVPDEPDAG